MTFDSLENSKKNINPFLNNKFHVKSIPTEYTLVHNQNPEVLLKGTLLNAVINTQCAQSHNPNMSISLRALNQLKSEKYLEVVQKLSQFTLPWTLESDATIEELKQLALKDPCLIGLTNIQNLELKSTDFNDPHYSKNLGLLGLHSKESFDFFNHSTHGSTKEIVIAILDTGFDFNNLDLKNVLFTDSQNEHGHNFIRNSGNIQDDNGHGTSIASIIASPANNQLGIVGVMPKNLKIYPLKVLDQNKNSNTSFVVQAIEYASAQHVDIINISMGGDAPDPALQSAMSLAATNGIFLSVSAGNKGKLVNSSGPFPAAYCRDISGCVTVGAISAQTYKKSSFSEYSSSYVDIMAPGDGGIYAAVLGNKYESIQGTSFSAPFVTGAAALTISFLKTHNISYDSEMIETILKDSAIKASTLKSYAVNGNALDLDSLRFYLSSTYLSKIDGGFDED